MSLYLVQHGKSLPGSEDPEKGLGPEGVAAVQRIADVAKGYRIHVSGIFHSGKKRARQTADILSHALNPENGVRSLEGLNPLDDPADFVLKITADGNDRMIVGHLPFMARLCALLITGDVNCPVFKFQNGGIVCLDYYPEDGGWLIRWALMPEIK